MNKLTLYQPLTAQEIIIQLHVRRIFSVAIRSVLKLCSDQIRRYGDQGCTVVWKGTTGTASSDKKK